MWTEEIPKIELHCHLDGSIPIVNIREICTQEHIIIPAQDSELRQQIEVNETCESLAQYLKAFELPLRCLKSEKAFFDAAYAVAASAASENVCYMEIRFAPLLSVTEGLGAEAIIEAVIAGMKKAEEQKGIYSAAILCGMRHFSTELNMKTLKLTKEYLGKGVVAADLAGDESRFANHLFKPYFDEAQKLDIPITIHAGECKNANNIQYAVEHGAKRIGHGIAMQGNEKMQNLCMEKGIGIEMCPSSNLQTKAISSISKYPFREFWNRGLKVSVNTDNRTVTNTTITQELNLLKREFGLKEEEGKVLMLDAVEMSFAEPNMKSLLKKKIVQGVKK